MWQGVFAFVFGILSSLILGYFSFVYFRRVKTGVKSRFLPDRKKLSENKKSTGGAFSSLGAVAAGFAVTAVWWEAQEMLSLLSCLALCVPMCLAGFAEDRMTDLKGEAVGLKGYQRIFSVMLAAAAFSLLYLAVSSNSVVSLPFSKGGIRLGGMFCPVIVLLTVVFSEGARLSCQTDGTANVRCFLNLCALAAVCMITQDSSGLKIPMLFAGVMLGTLFWCFPSGYLKSGLADRYLSTALTVSACVVTNNEGSLLILGMYELLVLLAFPADKLVYKITGGHIFLKLPVDEHLKSCKMSEKRIFAFYIIISFAFAAAVISSAVISRAV